MFAKVFPILKLPRRFGAFDYRIPDGVTFAVGDVIRISFRRRQLFGIVSDVLGSTKEHRVIETSPDAPIFTVSAAHIDHLRTIALELGQSVSSILAVAFDGLQPLAPPIVVKSVPRAPSLSIPQETIDTVRGILDILKDEPRIACAIDDETTAVLAHALCKSRKGQVLIVVPRERDAQCYASVLQPFLPMVLTGKTKSFERNSIIRAWKNGARTLLIGTRQSTLIEPNTLDAVIVTQAACEDHGSTMRNPHIDAVRAAEALAAHHTAQFIAADPLPSLSSTYTLHALGHSPMGEPTPSKSSPPLPLAPSTLRLATTPTIIDATNRGESSAYPLLTQTLLEAIKTALHSEKKVLLSFNRKGVAKRLECKMCQHVPFCGTCGSLPTVRLDDLLCEACGTEMWKPTTCPACNSPKIGPRLIGGTRIVDDLKKAFPDARVGTIQKGHVDRDADIVVATEYFWSSVVVPFKKHGLGLVAELLADVGFAPGDYRGAEKTARKVQRLLNLATREHAECIIQTVARDRLLSLLGPEHVTQHELTIREKYLLPPFGVIVTFERATREELPSAFLPHITDRHGVLTAKISHELYATWQQHFPAAPDHINIRIQH